MRFICDREIQSHLKEPSGRNDNHQTLCQLLNLRVQAIVGITAANTCTALERVCHEHAMLREEPAALHHIVAAPTHERGADDAHNLGKKIVVLLEGTRVGRVDLELRVCRE